MFLRRELDGVVKVLGLLFGCLLNVHHAEALARADVDALLAARAVQRGHLDAEAQVCERLLLLLRNTLHGKGLVVVRFGRLLGFVLRDDERTDGGMRADKRAHVALQALVRVPRGDGNGDPALLLSGRVVRLSSAVKVFEELRDRDVVPDHLNRGCLELLNVVAFAVRSDRCRGRQRRLAPSVRVVVHFGQLFERLVDCRDVGIDDLVALLGKLCPHGGFEELDGAFDGDDVREFEECSLEDSVCVHSQTASLCNLDGIDVVELELFLGNLALDRPRDMSLELLGRPLGREHEDAALLSVVKDRVLGQVRRLVASDKVGFRDRVDALDWLWAEAQVGDGDTARLVRGEEELALCVKRWLFADQFNRHLVPTDSAVAAHAPEEALFDALVHHRDGCVDRERGVCDIVDDTDREALHRLEQLELVED